MLAQVAARYASLLPSLLQCLHASPLQQFGGSPEPIRSSLSTVTDVTLCPSCSRLYGSQRLQSGSSKYVPTLDGWRALAILLVLFDHSIFRTFHPFGWTLVGGHGVEIFFVLSGYLITGKLLEDASLQNFYLRRAFRILPVLFAYLGVVSLTGLFLHRLPVQRSEVVSSLLFIRNFFLYPTATSNGVGWFTAHLWSLSIEEQFYLLWPLFLLKLGKQNSRRQLFAALALFTFWSTIFVLVHIGRVLHIGNWHWMPHLNYTGLVVGCILRIGFSHPFANAAIRKIFLKRSTMVVIIALGYVALFHKRVTPFDPLILGAALCATLVEPTGFAGRILEMPLLRWIGRLSYSLYIWQQIFLGFGVDFRPFGIADSFPNNLAAVLMVACLSYYGMERPLLRIGQRIASPSSGPPISIRGPSLECKLTA